MKPFYYINNATIGEFTGEKFDMLERATEESLELAEANPGQSFEILKCVGHSSTSKASTFWMDEEEPLESSEIPDGIPPLPHGWVFACAGALQVKASGRHKMDVARYLGDPSYANRWDTTGWNGTLRTGYHAVRIGSEIARLNGITTRRPL